MTTADLLLIVRPTPAGRLHLLLTPEDDTVRAAGFGDPDANHARLPPALQERGLRPGDHPAATVLDRWSDGDLSAFDELVVEQPGGEFFQACWSRMRAVTPGSTISYAELATRAGRPSAVRAAASACARNLIAPIVACHRILRSDGGLGGYYYGLDVKRDLLAHEARHTAGTTTATGAQPPANGGSTSASTSSSKGAERVA